MNGQPTLQKRVNHIVAHYWPTKRRDNLYGKLTKVIAKGNPDAEEISAEDLLRLPGKCIFHIPARKVRPFLPNKGPKSESYQAYQATAHEAKYELYFASSCKNRMRTPS